MSLFICLLSMVKRSIIVPLSTDQGTTCVHMDTETTAVDQKEKKKSIIITEERN